MLIEQIGLRNLCAATNVQRCSAVCLSTSLPHRRCQYDTGQTLHSYGDVRLPKTASRIYISIRIMYHFQSFDHHWVIKRSVIAKRILPICIACAVFLNQYPYQQKSFWLCINHNKILPLTTLIKINTSFSQPAQSLVKAICLILDWLLWTTSLSPVASFTNMV